MKTNQQIKAKRLYELQMTLSTLCEINRRDGYDKERHAATMKAQNEHRKLTGQPFITEQN